MVAGPIGIVANPASGKDIRRLVAQASVFGNQEKRSIVRRVILGAVAAGADRFVYLADSHGIVSSAIADLGLAASFEALPTPHTGTALDTTCAAKRMREKGCSIVITLGGDGTNRAFARGWLDVPVLPMSTGTNNVFPEMREATAAGAAAGLVAAGAIQMAEASSRAKVVHVSIDGESEDLALIDAVLIDEPFVGSRAIWQADRIRTIVLTRAEPAAVGMSGVGGLLRPLSACEDTALVITTGAGGRILRAPIAPGLYADVGIRSIRELGMNEVVVIDTPGVLAFDGERERPLRAGQTASLVVRRDGPQVLDVAAAMRLAALRSIFVRDCEVPDGD